MKNIINDIRELCFLFPFYIFVIGLVYCLVISVNEIASRQSMLHMVEILQTEALSDQSTSLREENQRLYLNTQNFEKEKDAIGVVTNLNEVQALFKELAKDEDSSEDDIPSRGNDLLLLKNMKTRLITLSAVGANAMDTNILGASIMKELANYSYIRESYIATAGYMSTNKPSPSSLLDTADDDFPLKRLRSDNLLAIAMTCAGMIGAFSAAYRKRKLDPQIDENSGSSIVGMTVEAVVIGCASGLLTFLAVKGGKGVFFMEMNGEMNNINPYSGAFAGFIAGLFTEKIFGLLSELVDSAVKRIRDAASNPTSNPPTAGKPTNER